MVPISVLPLPNTYMSVGLSRMIYFRCKDTERSPSTLKLVQNAHKIALCFVQNIHKFALDRVQTSNKFRVPQQFCVKEQRPALGLDFLARVGLAANLSRCHAHQGMLAERVAYLSIGKFLQFLIADEQGIVVVVVQRVAAVLQLVVVNHRDERMQLRCPDIAGVVVDRVNL